MSALWLDIEVLADREEELQMLFAELAGEEADDETSHSFRLKFRLLARG